MRRPDAKDLLGEAVNRLGEETGFSQRLRRLTPARALRPFVDGLDSRKINTIADLVRLFPDLTGIPMAYRTFHDRLSHPAFPQFLQSSFKTTMAGLSERIVRGRSRHLRSFEDILVQDGSPFTLNDALSSQFPGPFTKNSTAAAEVRCTYSLYEGQATRIAIAPTGKRNARSCPRPRNSEESSSWPTEGTHAASTVTRSSPRAETTSGASGTRTSIRRSSSCRLQRS